MITINIDAETSTVSEMELVLEHIAHQVGQGYTSGINLGASWSLEGEEEPENDDE